MEPPASCAPVPRKRIFNPQLSPYHKAPRTSPPHHPAVGGNDTFSTRCAGSSSQNPVHSCERWLYDEADIEHGMPGQDIDHRDTAEWHPDDTRPRAAVQQEIARNTSLDDEVEAGNPVLSSYGPAFQGVVSSEKNGEIESDQSFKESFYSSGTDWSCLNEVDDYGLPCKSIGERDMIEMAVRKSDSRCHEEVLGEPANKGLCGKLVQSTLAAYWGNASKPMGRPLRTEIARKESKISPNFKNPSVFASPVVGGGHPLWNTARGHGDVKAVAAPGRNCPFYKKIPGTAFTVDAFRYGAVQGCSAYFLTHFHSDHYGGLTKSWSHGPIYCTPVTARLLVLCLSIDERWIYPVPLGTARVIEGVQVKFLEANHCPGAAIILFCLKNGQAILHTGDFRACKEMQSYPDLIESRINILFLDTTYCNPRYRFPSQKEVIDFVIRITQDNLKKNSRTLVIVGAYSIGKERVYLGIAEALKMSIFVEKRRSRILMALEWPELARRLCADAGSTTLHVLPIGFLRPQRLKAYLQDYPRFNSVLAFRPTGWTYSEKIANELHLLKPVVAGPVTIYGVPYSEHSSFNELRQFVQFLQPEKVIPTVNNGRPEEREKMQSHFRQWLMKQSSEF